MHISNITPLSTNNFTGNTSSKDKNQGLKHTCNNALMGTLMALASLSPMNASANTNTVNSSAVQATVVDSEDDDLPSYTANFKDENGILEPTDFVYSSPEAKKLAKNYLDGLNPYMGKECTQAVADMAQHLANVFNTCNNYAYDIEKDEMVKDAKSSIMYDKSGRVLATSIKYSSGVEEKVTYKYFPNGNIDRAVYADDKVIEYRKNGTRFSIETIDPFRPKETIFYNNQGKMTARSVHGRTSTTELTYDENGDVIKHFYKDDNSGWQKIYNGGSLVLTTYYDGKGRVKSYVDKYFEKDGEDIVVSGYLSSRVIHRGEPYNILYKEAPLDGKILKPIRQGTTGTCYAAGIINSLVRTQAGRQFLDDVLPSDYDKTKCVVEYKGLNKIYTVPADVISHNMSRLGRKDADYAGMIYAYEKFRESDDFINRRMNLPECFYKDHRGENDRRVDSGTATEFFYALTGKLMSESGTKITDADIRKAKQCLATGRGVVNAGTVQKEDKNDEIPLMDREIGVIPKHNVSIVGIDSRNVTIYDSVTEKESTYPIAKFKKYFSKLYWATLD
ncbi:MAG: hypothetical protein K6E29_05330 [Cyanobacteria bacterium RUI128]|nr:hypothetical protein [Cyanobacteria bacterium RUI128]